MTQAKAGTYTDDEYALWEDFHGTRSDFVAVDRDVLTRAFPALVPDGLRKNVKYVPVHREVLWEALTGTKYVVGWWNK